MLRKTLIAVLALTVFSSAHADYPDVQKALETLVDYSQQTLVPVEKEINALAGRVEKEARLVLEDPATEPSIREMTYSHLALAYSYAGQTDAGYFAKLKKLAPEIIKEFPASSAAALAEYGILTKEHSELDTEAFLKRIEEFSKTYPSSPYWEPLVVTHAATVKRDMGWVEASDLLKKALVFYPKSGPIKAFLARLDMIGKEASLTGPLLDGEEFDLKDMAGKVVVIDFWASWCAPCLKMTPGLIDLYERKKADGLEIVGVSQDDDAESLREYVKEKAVAWPQIYHPEFRDRAKLAKLFGVPGIPVFYVVGKDGKFAEIDVFDLQTLEKVVAQELAK